MFPCPFLQSAVREAGRSNEDRSHLTVGVANQQDSRISLHLINSTDFQRPAFILYVPRLAGCGYLDLAALEREAKLWPLIFGTRVFSSCNEPLKRRDIPPYWGYNQQLVRPVTQSMMFFCIQ